MLFIRLLSGRCLSYVKPRLGINSFGTTSITYEGIGNDRKWSRLETFGGKLTENIIQATARDVLMNSIRTLQHCRITAHVHDEIILEAPEETSLEEICMQMAKPPEWMPDILLRADGFVTDFYKKD